MNDMLVEVTKILDSGKTKEDVALEIVELYRKEVIDPLMRLLLEE